MLDTSYQFPEPYELEKWLREETESYSNTSFAGNNTYRWLKILGSDYFAEKYNLEELLDIVAVKRSIGGTVGEVIIKGKERELVVKGDNIRSALGGLKSNRFISEKIYSPEGKLEKLFSTEVAGATMWEWIKPLLQKWPAGVSIIRILSSIFIRIAL